jgi:MFS family permease
MPKGDPLTRATVILAFRTTVFLSSIHAIGGGFWYIVLTNMLRTKIARNDLALAANLWGIGAFIGYGCKLLSASLVGSIMDKYGRRPILLTNFIANFMTALIILLYPSIFTLFFSMVVLGLLDLAEMTIYSLVSDCGRSLAYVGGWRNELPHLAGTAGGGRGGQEPPTPTNVSSRRNSLQVNVNEDTLELREHVEAFRTKLFGIAGAWWVLTIGVAITIASIICVPNETKTVSEAVADHHHDAVISDISNTTATNSTSTSCEEDEESLHVDPDDISYLIPAAMIALACYLIGLLVCKFVLCETSQWSTTSDSSNEKITALQSFRLLFSTPWLRLLTTCLMITDMVQAGYLAVMLWFVVYQFNYTISEYSMLLLYALICRCLATTVVLSTMMKLMGLFGTLYTSCMVGTLNLLLTAIAGPLGPSFVWIGMTANIFTCHTPILRSKVSAEFSTNEQGKIQGGILVANTLSAMIGSAVSTFLFTLAVDLVEGKGYKVDECTPAARNLSGGAPFFFLTFCALATWVLVVWGRKFDPTNLSAKVKPADGPADGAAAS